MKPVGILIFPLLLTLYTLWPLPWCPSLSQSDPTDASTGDLDEHRRCRPAPPEHHQEPTWQPMPSHLPACALLPALVAIRTVRIKATDVTYSSRTTDTKGHTAEHKGRKKRCKPKEEPNEAVVGRPRVEYRRNRRHAKWQKENFSTTHQVAGREVTNNAATRG